MPRNTRTTDAEALRRAHEQRREADRLRQQTFFRLTGRDMLGEGTEAPAPAPEAVYYEEEGPINQEDWFATSTTNRPAQQDLNETTINNAVQRLLQQARTMPPAAPPPPPRYYFTQPTPDVTTWRALYGTPGQTTKEEDDSYDMTKMHKLGKWNDANPVEIEHRADFKQIGTQLEKALSSPSFYKEILQAIRSNTNRVVIPVQKEFPKAPTTDFLPFDYFTRFADTAKRLGKNKVIQISECYPSVVENPKELILGSDVRWGNFGYATPHGGYTFQETSKTNVSVKNKMDWFRFYEAVNDYHQASKKDFNKVEMTVIQAIDYALVYQYHRNFTKRYTVEGLLQTENQRNHYQAVIRYPKFSSNQSAQTYRLMKRNFLDLYPRDKRRLAASIVASNYNAHRGDFVVFLRMLYQIRYKEPMPENRIFYAYSRQSVQWGGNGVIDIGNGGGPRVNLAPKAWIDKHLYFKCLCCDKYQIYENRIIFSPRLTKTEGAELETFIKAFHPDAVIARIEKRQTEFKKTQAYKDSLAKPKEKVAKKNLEPFPLDEAKDPALIKNIKNSLNVYIKSWKTKAATTKSTDVVDEFGINHTELDRNEFVKPVQYHDTGHSQSNFSIYSPPFCTMCHNNLHRVHNPTVIRVDEDEEDETTARIIARIRAQRAPDRNGIRFPTVPGGGNYGGNVQNYSANPMDTYNGFRLGKNENKTIVFDKVLKLDPKTGKLVESKYQRDQTLYMGVELEVTPSVQVTNVLTEHCGMPKTDLGTKYTQTHRLGALIMRQYHNLVQSFIVKSDATTANGFEIVSVPGTHKWHIEEAWKGFFKEDYEDAEHARLAPSSWLCGWPNNGKPTKDAMYQNHFGPNRPICGIHVHVSREALSPLQLGKILFFIGNPYNKKFVEHVAGRNSQKYANILTKKLKDGNVLIKMKKNETQNRPTIAPHGDTKYQAINTNTGKPTIEFRIFRSNVTKYGFFKVLDFVHALVTWCANNSSNTNDLTFEKFVSWVDTQRGVYKYLTKWLIVNKYLNNIHTFNPKYSREFELEDSENFTSEKEVA